MFLISINKIAMTSKLTLTVDRDVIRRAKEYAKSTGHSLSGIVENHLKALTSDKNQAEAEIAPLTKSLKGSFKAPPDFDYKMNWRKNYRRNT